MHKAPKGIFEKDILQNTFRFTDEHECKNCENNSKKLEALSKALLLFKIKQNHMTDVLQQTHIVQNICQFFTPNECFENLRIVSKLWQNAVENSRFSGYYSYRIFETIFDEMNKIENIGKNIPIRYVKTLK